MLHGPAHDRELTVTAAGVIMKVGMVLAFLGSIVGLIVPDGTFTGMAGTGIFLMVASWVIIAAAKPRLGPVPSSWEAREPFSEPSA